jgi:hypothetical protein
MLRAQQASAAWSRKQTHDAGLGTGASDAFKRYGPCSAHMPNSDDEPGPPCSHTSSGADALPLSAGQYQKKCSACAVAFTSKKPA